MKARPEVRQLFGPDNTSAWFAAGAISMQVAMALAAERLPWWAIILLAYGVGAFAVHALNCVVHECTHNLVFARPSLNKALALIATLPTLVPSAMAFRHYHLLHHSCFGIRGMDSDVPSRWEVRLVGNNAVGKLVWLLLLPLSYGVLHPLFVRRRLPLDGWFAANVASIALAWILVVSHGGWPAVLYLLASTYFSVGPHPVGAHILQEHVAFDGGNGMASYYGPLNRISINLGYHLEHHDLPNVAGSRLPLLRTIVPGFYADHFRHSSRTVGLWRFVTNPQVGLDSRPIRESHGTI